jgi:hypothetical protein
MRRFWMWTGLLVLVIAGALVLCLQATAAEEHRDTGSPSTSRTAAFAAANRETTATSAELTNKAMSARVARNVQEIESRVARVKAAEKNKLVGMSETFNQINECCDELQGKNGRPAPPAEEWGVRDAASHRRILDALAALENDAEGMRDISRENSYGATQPDTIQKAWEQFVKHFAQLAELLTRPQK